MTQQPQDSVLERERCPGCGSTAFNFIVRESFESLALKTYFEQHYEGRADLKLLKGFSYELVRCRDCGLGYQRTIPGTHLLNQIYEHWIPPTEKERLQRQYDLNDFRYWAEQVQFLVQYLRLSPHSIRVFDFGLGWSEWASMARAFGCQVAGAELSPARIQHARSIGIEIIEWNDIPTRSFHFINTEQVFEHLLEPLETLKHLAGSLETGGILKISVPDSRSALRRIEKGGNFGALSRSDRMPVAPLEHVNCFEYRSLVRLAGMAHLRPIRPRLRLVYDSASGWLSPHRALKALLRPIYRHWWPKSTFVYFVKQ
ncbi:MAG: class I SAM-dependent methyltransferase [Gammaproteobacteria bacterium]